MTNVIKKMNSMRFVWILKPWPPNFDPWLISTDTTLAPNFDTWLISTESTVDFLFSQFSLFLNHDAPGAMVAKAITTTPVLLARASNEPQTTAACMDTAMVLLMMTVSSGWSVPFEDNDGG